MKIVGNKEKGYQKTSSFPGRKEDIKAKEQATEENQEVQEVQEIADSKETKKNKNKQ